MKSKRWLSVFSLFVVCVWFSAFQTEAAGKFQVTGQCEVSPKATIRIYTDAVSFSGFDVYREDDSGVYQYVGYVGIRQNVIQDDDDIDYEYDSTNDNYESQWVEENNHYVEYRTYTFTDPTDLEVLKSYRYKVVGYTFKGDVKTEVDSAIVSVTILSAGPSITYGKRSGKLGAQLEWTRVDGADGYIIYCAKDYDEKSNYLTVDYYDISQYQVVQVVDNPNTVSASFKDLMNGVTYTYRVSAFNNIAGNRVESTVSQFQNVTMDYYSYDGENYYQRVKRAFKSEKAKKKNYKTAKKAAKQMKTIKIKVWDYKTGKKGKKVTKTKWLTVNKRLAPSIQQMFEELYKSDEKQVIHDIGCYSYRTGEHMYGMAIDINPNENYMVDGKKVLAGSYWKPKKDPYSIPKNCEFVRIMARYGFYRGEWGARKDYMHFSYFGT